MTDRALIPRLQNREPPAFRELCEQHLSSLWRFVASRLGDDLHQAEDIVSETMLALLKALDEGSAVDNPGGWLRTVAHNKLRDHFRAVARVRHLVDQTAQDAMPCEPTTPDDLLQQKELRAAVREILETLDEQQRLALEWKYLDRLSVREIAARWATTEKAVESILFRARREFRTKVDLFRRQEEAPSLPHPQRLAATAEGGGSGHAHPPPVPRHGGPATAAGGGLGSAAPAAVPTGNREAPPSPPSHPEQMPSAPQVERSRHSAEGPTENHPGPSVSSLNHREHP